MNDQFGDKSTMSKIIRVWYKQKTSQQGVKNTFTDFKLLPSQEDVEKIELRKIIPEHSEIELIMVPTTKGEKC